MSTQALKILVCIITAFSSLSMASQNTQDYFLKIKEGHDLGIIQKTVKADQTLTLSMANTNFANFLNAKPIYKFEKPFPNLQSSFLDKVYLINIPFETSINDIIYSLHLGFRESKISLPKLTD